MARVRVLSVEQKSVREPLTRYAAPSWMLRDRGALLNSTNKLMETKIISRDQSLTVAWRLVLRNSTSKLMETVIIEHNQSLVELQLGLSP